MSTYELVVQEDNTAFCYINGQWKWFKCVEPMLHHNNGKHLVYDVNNWHHNPIGFEDS